MMSVEPVKSNGEAAIEDVDIILEVLTGNRNAYAELLRRYEGRVRGYCLMMLSNAAAADDAAQEVFIKAYQSLGRFQGKSSFPTWIYRIAANHCTDILRSASRKRAESWEALLEKEGDHIEALLSVPAKRPADPAESELLARLLATLSEKSRTMIMLRELQGMSYGEIAQTLNCSLDAVKSRLKRTRQELSETLRHFMKTEPSKS